MPDVKLTDADGQIALPVKAGSSAKLTVVINDESGAPFAKNSIITLTLTLSGAGEIINDWDQKDVKDANGGLVTDEGVFTLTFQADDNVIVDETVGRIESHTVKIEWDYIDTNAIEQHGIEEFIFQVEQVDI